MRFRSIMPLLALALVQCKDSARSHKWFAMDTNMSVALYGDDGAMPDDSIFLRLEAETERLNVLFSDYSRASALSRVKGWVGDTVAVDPEIYPVLETALEFGQSTVGSFDITLHDLKTLWGLESGLTGRVPDSSAIDSLMRRNPIYRSGWDSIDVPSPLTLVPPDRAVLRQADVQLDLGAIAKGHIIDRLHRLLDSLGSPNHILMAGGEIRLGGTKKSGPWMVGIRHPRRADSLIGKLRSDRPKAVSTSGDYERFFEADGIHYHHIFDPRTGRPSQAALAVTVVSDSSVLSDALSTSLFILGPERGARLARRYRASAVWFKSDGQGICATAMPEIEGMLDIKGTARCGSL
jgi:FAD:protein FMN transferase